MGDEAFYSTTAQVIPVLLLALMFERRYFEIRDAPAWADLFLLSMLIALAGGELAALAAAKDPQQATELTDILIFAALVLGGLGLFVPLFRERFRSLGETLPTWVVLTARVGWLPLVVAVMATATFVDADVLTGAIAALVLATLVGGWIVGVRGGFAADNDADPASVPDENAGRERPGCPAARRVEGP